MNEFNWSSYGRWENKMISDSYGHDCFCNCDSCHKIHIDSWKVEENARDINFDCCRNEISMGGLNYGG